MLERFVYLDGRYLVSLDGTEYFSSKKIHCASCLEKHHRNGTVTYYHQLLGATLVHPDLKEVIPLAPEPIIQQDGHTKNDCERNATRRWLKQFRKEHPHLRVIVVEDALSANAPHLKDLAEARVRYIIGVKPGDHTFLFEHLRGLDEAGRMQVLTLVDPATNILHHFRFCNGAPLNESNPDVLVNVLEYWEVHPDRTVQHFSWITDFTLNADNVWAIMRGGRARWKIENETFNTLKNQGYNLEHNYGHGEQNLSVVLALLMMLAFLVDQVQQLCCPRFQAAWHKMKTKCHLWEEIRNHFRTLLFDSMEELLEEIRKVDGARRFAPNHANQPGMRVAQRIDSDAAEKIKIRAALRIIDAAATSVREHYRRTPVGVHQEARFVSADFCGRNPRGSRMLFLRHFLTVRPRERTLRRRERSAKREFPARVRRLRRRAGRAAAFRQRCALH